MKKILNFSVFILLLSTLNTKAQRIARVQKIDGLDVYILNQPLRSYEIVNKSASYIQPEAIFSKGLRDETIEEKVSALVRKIKKDANKYGQQVDAIMYTDGRGAFGIHFTDEEVSNDGLARVQKMNDMYVFVLAQPAESYMVEGSRRSLIKLKSLRTRGIINNTIKEDVNGFIYRLQRHYTINGIIYNTGKSALGIQLEGAI